MTTLVLLGITALAYAAGVIGLALTVGAPWGWLILAVGGLIPGAFLLARAAEDRSVERDRATGEAWTPPRDHHDGAPEQLPPIPVQYD